MGIGYDNYGDKGVFSHLGGLASGGGHYPPQQHGGYPPQGYAYHDSGYSQTTYPPSSGYPSHNGGYSAHPYPGSSGQYHSGYGGHGMNGIGFISGALHGYGGHQVAHGLGSHGGYGSYGQHLGSTMARSTMRIITAMEGSMGIARCGIEFDLLVLSSLSYKFVQCVRINLYQSSCGFFILLAGL